MYRLIKLQKLSLQRAVTRKSIDSSLLSHRNCLLCNRVTLVKAHPVSAEFVKELSTSLHPASRSIVRKRRRTRRGSSELLTVGQDSVTEARAEITKLNAKDVTILVQCPDLGLEELHRLKEKKHLKTSVQNSVTTLRESFITPVFPSFDDGEALSPLPLASALVFDSASSTSVGTLSSYPGIAVYETPQDLSRQHDQPEEVNVTNPSEVNLGRPEHDASSADHVSSVDNIAPSSDTAITSDEAKKRKKRKPGRKSLNDVLDNENEELKLVEWNNLLAKYKMRKAERRINREINFVETYLQVLVNSRMMKPAYTAVHMYCKRAHKRENSFIPVSIFEIVLRGCASAGNMDTVRALLDMMNNYNVKLSTSCYAACMECLGRVPDSEENVELAQSILDDMKVNGYEVNDLFTSCKYVGDQKEMVLKMVRKMHPEYTVPRHPPDMDYSVKLLADFEEVRQSNGNRYASPGSHIVSSAVMEQIVNEQVANDISGYINVPNIAFQRGDAAIQQSLKTQAIMEKVWRKDVQNGLRRDLKGLTVGRSRKKHHLHTFLKAIPELELIDIVLREVKLRIGDSDDYSPPLSSLYFQIAEKVRKKYDVLGMEKNGQLEKVNELYQKYCSWHVEPDKCPPGITNPRMMWQILEYNHQNGPDLDVANKPWLSETMYDIGKFLYGIILRDIMIDINQNKESCKAHYLPAFYIVYRKVGPGQQEQLKLHPAAAKIFYPGGQPFLVMETSLLPMVSPPKPWSSPRSGGLPISNATLLRIPEGPSRKMRDILIDNFESTPLIKLYPALDALNQLGSVPWKVNTEMLDVVVNVFNSGGSHKLCIPEPPSTHYPEPEIPQDATAEQIRKVLKERQEIRQKRAEMYSLWCDALYRLSLANFYRNRVFWLPHNMDFRGRVYPIAPHLQHMGGDMARSILMFARGERLGPDGLNWLKIHAINLTGLKKRNTLKERLEFADEIMPKILDSADNPLEGEKWWMDSDEPWQTLAVCKEIAAAVHSGDSENFISHYPVHQDGSCNGLQHYAALGRDLEGAMSVNLAALDKPADVYSCVSDIVERNRAKDAQEGNVLAQQLEGYVCRKLVKQTVMTTVYGVTNFGARLQIGGQLKDMGYPKDNVRAAAAYLTELTFASLGEMFTSTKKIQDWLTTTAKCVSKSLCKPVEWITPLGLPVTQPYYKTSKIPALTKALPKGSIKGPPKGLPNRLPRGFLIDPQFSKREVPNVLKQRNGFPPNFIHSLDSCHMMLTSLFCEQANITYVSVHDCFWVHACNVDELNKICRNQFVALHSEPILENLSEFLIERYCNSESAEKKSAQGVERRYLKRLLCRVPPKGAFDLNEVLASTYFFS